MRDGDDDELGVVKPVIQAEGKPADQESAVPLVDEWPSLGGGLDGLEGLLDRDDKACAEPGARLFVLVGRVLELRDGLTEEPDIPLSGTDGHGARTGPS